MHHAFRFAMLTLPAIALVAACTGNADSSTTATPAPSPMVGCMNDPRVTAFASGMAAQSASGTFTAEIVTAAPSPPERGPGDAGMNEWTMRLKINGAPATAGAVTVSTLMPDHGHGSPRVPVVTPNADGTSTVSNLYLFMAGVWEITFLANGTEPAKFSICVE